MEREVKGDGQGQGLNRMWARAVTGSEVGKGRDGIGGGQEQGRVRRGKRADLGPEGGKRRNELGGGLDLIYVLPLQIVVHIILRIMP